MWAKGEAGWAKLDQVAALSRLFEGQLAMTETRARAVSPMGGPGTQVNAVILDSTAARRTWDSLRHCLKKPDANRLESLSSRSSTERTHVSCVILSAYNVTLISSVRNRIEDVPGRGGAVF